MTAAPVFQLHPDEGPAPEEAPNPTEIMPSPSDPMGCARVILAELEEDGQTLLRRWRGGWMSYAGPHWTEDEETAVRKMLYTRMEHVDYYAKGKEGELELKPWNPNRSKIADLMAAIESITHLPTTVEAPSWLDTGEAAGGYVPCANGLVNIQTQTLEPATPRYFGTVSVPFEYDPAVGEPVEWLKFLRVLWPDPAGEEILALQEWFGYVLSGRTDLQKILLMVGPPRCGKGTIARVLQQLIGRGNHVAPTLADLATNFGLQPLIGKMLAVIGDARLGGPGQEQVVPRLLSLSGEDDIQVDRKNREPWNGRIPARFMVLSNELPKFGDVSGAIASRFIILTLEESFLGREDIHLGDRLREELPGILKWALEGLVRLNDRGRLLAPASSEETAELLRDLVSPMGAFLKDVCITDPEAKTPTGELYRQYEAWCKENGRGTGSVQKWSSDLRTLLPKCRTNYRPKVDGKPLARHTTGLRINPEWLTRERDDLHPAEAWASGRAY